LLDAVISVASQALKSNPMALSSDSKKKQKGWEGGRRQNRTTEPLVSEKKILRTRDVQWYLWCPEHEIVALYGRAQL